MDKVLVTGATGLIGSNVCAELFERGFWARALVRERSDSAALEAMGVEIARGDIGSPSDVRRALADCAYVIHTAALVVGGPKHPDEEYHRVNVVGTLNVLDASRDEGVRRVVSFASAPNPRRTTYPEGAFGDDPYYRAKLEIAREIVRRSDAGEDCVEISPAAAFGPAPTGARAVEPPGFNSRVVLALRGEFPTMPAFAVSFNLARDVARSTVRALTAGQPGVRYDLGGPLDESVDTVSFLNLACERAGTVWRVRASTSEELESPPLLERFGPSMCLAGRLFAESRPDFGPQPSEERLLAAEVLGHDPVPIGPAVDQTVDWMMASGLI